MARSRKSDIRIGIKFTQRIAEELRQSATYAARGNFRASRDCYETVEQMMDTFLTETGLGEYLDSGGKNATNVAPAPQPEEERSGADTPDRKSAKTTKRAKPRAGAKAKARSKAKPAADPAAD